jgi:hypothetical protein
VYIIVSCIQRAPAYEGHILSFPWVFFIFRFECTQILKSLGSTIVWLWPYPMKAIPEIRDTWLQWKLNYSLNRITLTRRRSKQNNLILHRPKQNNIIPQRPKQKNLILQMQVNQRPKQNNLTMQRPKHNNLILQRPKRE